MAYWNGDGVSVASWPNSYAGSSASSDLTGDPPSVREWSSGRSLAEDPLYRELNLALNKIRMQRPCDPLPEHIASLVDDILQDRDSPSPSLDEVKQDGRLYSLLRSATEPDVERYFNTHVFPDPDSSGSLRCSRRQPMAEHTVPSTGSKHRVSTPVPNLLYGYDRLNAFTDAQQD